MIISLFSYSIPKSGINSQIRIINLRFFFSKLVVYLAAHLTFWIRDIKKFPSPFQLRKFKRFFESEVPIFFLKVGHLLPCFSVIAHNVKVLKKPSRRKALELLFRYSAEVEGSERGAGSFKPPSNLCPPRFFFGGFEVLLQLGDRVILLCDLIVLQGDHII